MSKRYEYSPRGVCSSKIIVESCDNVITYVEIVGGCPGNTIAISKLCIGMKVEDAVNVLNGIDCRGRGTSCPDQLAIALTKLKESEFVTN